MDNMIQCTRCGSALSSSRNTRFVVCGSTTKWEKNNYPSPNTLTTTKDGLAVWHIGLCDSCMPSGYKRYLKRELDDVLLKIFLFGFLLALAVVAIVFHITGNILVAIAVTIALVAGIVGAPYYGIRLITTLVRKAKFSKTGIVPQRHIDNCFVGEGERIISELQSDSKDTSEGVFGQFNLPPFKDITSLGLSEKEREKVWPLLRETRIISVAGTVAQAYKGLPNGWDPVWQQSSVSENMSEQTNAADKQ